MKSKTSRLPAYEPATHLAAEPGTKPTSRYPDVYTVYQPGVCSSAASPEAGVYVFTSVAAKETPIYLRIDVLSDRVWRFRYALWDFKKGPSYALAQEPQPAAGLADLAETEAGWRIATAALTCTIARADLRLALTDNQSGKVVLADAAPFMARETIKKGVEQLRMSWTAQPGEAYLGLGDKSCPLNIRGRYLQMWATDAFGFGPQSDPLYRAIPFYYGLHEGMGYGLFFNNTWRTHFDFDTQNDGITRMWADGGEMDFFFMFGPKLEDVARQYHLLTGVPELPPLWALGFHQCRWSYRTDKRVRELAAEFRERNIPCDAIYLDIDYMDAYKCFTWNRESFPDPAQLSADLKNQGFRLVTMIDPGISAESGYAVYDEGLEKDAFCRRTSGELMMGPVWPVRCVWPDFTRSDVREWWGRLYAGLYLEDGISGFWNDMNEPAVFKVDNLTFPDEVKHDLDGQGGTHPEAHNIYGMQMAKASFEGLKALDPGRRPFLVSRATFCGGQRYSAIWTGDNIASWEHLHLANIQCQRSSISGFSFVGTDIGGFVDQPTGELFSRWVQLGAFHPFFRIHSMGNNADGASEANADEVSVKERENRMDQEPWSFGEPFTTYARKAIELRYRLLPYLYTAFFRHAHGGIPLLRSLVFENQLDPNTLRRESEFMFGPHLLVGAIEQRGIKSHRVYLPAGSDWYDYYSGRKQSGADYVRVNVKPDRLPLFVRAGAIIPQYPLMQFTGEFEPDTADLRVYYGSATASECYFDAGDGYGYKQGEYRLHTFHTAGTERSMTITQQQEGAYADGPAVFRLIFIGLPFVIAEIIIDGMPVQEMEEAEGGIAVLAPIDFSSVEVRG